MGNRLTGPKKEGYTYDPANRLTTDGKYAYSYDANGNLIGQRSLDDGAVTTYTYDAEDRLIRAVTPKAEVTFQYDPLGRRMEKRVVHWQDEDGGREPDEEEEGRPRVTRYLYDQEDILVTFDDAGHELGRYTHGPGIDEPLAEVRRDRTRFYHADVLGSILALSEKHGNPIRSYQYSAFGLPADHQGDSQPYRYTGREWDKEVGLYYYRARYYAPRFGRFLREDPIARARGGPNLYAYVGNGPTNWVDPLGLARGDWWDPRTYIAWSISYTWITGEGAVWHPGGIEQKSHTVGTFLGISLDIQLGSIPPLDKRTVEWGLGLGKHLGAGQYVSEPKPCGGYEYSGLALHIGLGIGLPIYSTTYDPVWLRASIPSNQRLYWGRGGAR